MRKRVVQKNGECNVSPSNVAKRRRRYLQDIFTTLVDIQINDTHILTVLSLFLVAALTVAVDPASVRHVIHQLVASIRSGVVGHRLLARGPPAAPPPRPASRLQVSYKFGNPSVLGRISAMSLGVIRRFY
ncbi:Inward rectifier potassium channel 18 [Portunus trituberculatus]|uniref:Inward rectifier potassium channel 18 n=1 Tax=Portunus trituberculatus TaxID=210409 RepID=A0A5B7FEL5_PORTR|nr:Inward rectifier potassium channel 18 [Portunus trituberculatus]